ncbi:MOSC domain protein [Aspergillus tanneri]|uniref:Mitochondrial amidoxime reducing component 2 n=1 Tax=Aspergillus tanneri TaxID=1220188 RepID=A0A5M9MZN6_9EURO|nr:Mitochondrial amidoxime reducing component 2 [Aspergillus tanneri]KAA8652318.1 Mitochondrial amidoxime reducing component 2 [Aspergillus tanneri]
MKITQLYTYPIKSLRGVALPAALLTRTGFEYDRRFMLLKVNASDDGTDNNGKVIVTYQPTGVDGHRIKTLEIPLVPDVRGLEELGIMMHQSPTKGYNMGTSVLDIGLSWRTWDLTGDRCWGVFPPGKSAAHRKPATTPLVSTRSVATLAALTLLLNAIGVPMVRETTGSSLLPSLAATAVAVILSVALGRRDWSRGGKRNEEKITFADVAPYLVVSETSVQDLSTRLAGDVEMDVTKFRPNIVVAGAATAYEEDFWAELAVGENESRLLITANCVRCQSINVDYDTGKMARGEAGNALKRLMKDRRVDKGAKYSPVFGRYTFLDRESENTPIRVGDEVIVTKMMDERSVIGEFPELL